MRRLARCLWLFLSCVAWSILAETTKGVSHAKWPKANHECAATETGSVICCALEAVDTGAARPESERSQNAQRNYERYLALARAEAQIGNTVAAENYYQYAEHYFRSMSSDRERT